MAKEKMPFELERPDSQTPVTKTTELKHGNKWLNAHLDEQEASLASIEETVNGEPVEETFTSADFCGLIYVLNAGGGTPATSETFTDSDYCGFFFSQAIAEYEDIIGTYNSSNLCGFFYSNSQGKFIAATSTYDGIYVPLVAGKKYKFNGSVKTFATEPTNGATMSVVTSINKDVAFTAGENDKYAFVTVTLASFSELTVKELRTPTASEGQFMPSSNVYNAIVFPLISGKSYQCDADILTFASEPVASAFASYTNSRSANTVFTASANENYGMIVATVASFSIATLITQGSGSTDPGFIAATSSQDGIKFPLTRGKKYRCTLALKTFATQPALNVLESAIGEYNANTDFIATDNESYAFIPITKSGFTNVVVSSDGEGLKNKVDRTSEIIGGENISKSYNSDDFCDFIYSGTSGGGGFVPATSSQNGICVPLVQGASYTFSQEVKTFASEPHNGDSATIIATHNANTAFTAGANEQYAFIAVTVASFSSVTMTMSQTISKTSADYVGYMYRASNNTFAETTEGVYYNGIKIALTPGVTYQGSLSIRTFAVEPEVGQTQESVAVHNPGVSWVAGSNELWGFLTVDYRTFDGVTISASKSDTLTSSDFDDIIYTVGGGFVPASNTQYYNGIFVQLQEDATYSASLALKTFAELPAVNQSAVPVANHNANTPFKATDEEKYAFFTIDTRTFSQLTITADKTGLLFEVSKKADQKDLESLEGNVATLNTTVQSKASTTYVDGKVATANSKINSLQREVDDLAEQIDEGGGGSGSGGGSSAAIRKDTELVVEDITADLQFEDGYCDKSGYKGGSSSYKRTEKIPCKAGDIFKTLSQYTSFRYVTAYTGDTVVAASGAESVYTYTVPDDIDGIIITIYATQSTDEKTIVKKSYETVKHNSAEIPSFRQRKARVTIIDDDGYKEFATYFIPIMREYGIPICAACMGDVTPTGADSRYMNKEEMDEVVALGGEILVHGGTQLNTFPTLEEAYENVLLSQKSLQKMGYDADVYVYPNSGNNIAIREFMAQHFKCAFKTGSPQKYDNRTNDKCIPHYFIHRSSCAGYYDDKSADYGNYDTHTIQYFQALIDDCVQRKSWLVFMTHVWMMPPACSWRTRESHQNEVYYWKGDGTDLDEFALFRQIIEYILQLKQNGVDIEIVTASEGFDMFRNVQQCGDYLGYWNEDIRDVSYYQHAKPGSAFNAVGDWDLPASGQITHQSQNQ